MEISNFVRPESLEEAYTLIHEQKGFPIGGGAWSRMNSRKVELAVDLSALGLRFIRETGDTVEIGALTTARDIETSSLLKRIYGDFLSDSVSHIVGVQLKNIVTAGGTVAGRFGFSDLNTALSALNARIVLYGNNSIDFNDFLQNRTNGAYLIEKIILPVDEISGAYQSVRNTRNDFPILNSAAVHDGNGWRIAVGARPGSARLAVKAVSELGSSRSPDDEAITRAADTASDELTFGDDIRGDAHYRADVCKVLVKRCIEEAAR